MYHVSAQGVYKRMMNVHYCHVPCHVDVLSDARRSGWMAIPWSLPGISLVSSSTLTATSSGTGPTHNP